MNKTLVSFGQGWWERIPARFSDEEIRSLDGDPETRSKTLRDFEARSRRPALPEDASKAEEALKAHLQGEYTSASVVLPHMHGHACPKGGGWIRF